MSTTTTASRPGDAAEAVPRHLGLALTVISAAQLMVVLDATIVNIALPHIKTALGFSDTGLQWVINAYTLAFGGLLLLGGRAGDILGRRRVFIAGVLLFALASLLGGFATTEAWLLAARVAQGVGGAIASPTALSLVTTTFPEGPPRNRAMGVYAAMSGAGAAIGLLAGGVLTDLASWRWVLFVNAPIGVLVALLAPRVLVESESRPGRFDLPGALSVTAGMTLLVYGLTHAATDGWREGVTIGTLVASVLLLAAFVAIEARTPQPLMPLRILADRNRSGSYAVALCVGAAIFAMFFFLTLFVQGILHYSPLKAGFAFLPVSAGIVVAAGVTAQLVSRTGPRLPLTLGTLVATAALLWLSRIDAHTTYWPGLLGPMLVLALGMGLSFVPLTLTALANVRRQDAGLASALLNTGQQIGGSIGLAALVTVFSTIVTNRIHDAMAKAAAAGALPAGGRSAPPRALVDSATAAGYAGAFKVAAGIAAVGFVISLLTIRVGRDDVPAEGPVPVG